MEEKAEVFVITEQSLQEKIYIIRGQKVMLDFDLAEIYGYETKNFNRQVKNNQQKFEGADFMFQLSDEEVEELSRCKNFTLNRGIGYYIFFNEIQPYELFMEALGNVMEVV